MSAVTAAAFTGRPLGADLLEHLGHQLGSARRLLDAVLRQGAAIRGHDVTAVLGCVDEIQGEMETRARLEGERGMVLARAAAALGVSAHEVTLEGLSVLLDADTAARARTQSAELRGLLDELEREHTVNRALMRQEMTFLDHLVRLAGGEPEPGYRRDADGAARSAVPAPAGAGHLRLLDMRA